MQRKLAAIHRTLRDFGDQRRDLTLIVRARDAEVPLLAKLAERTRQERPDDLVLVFAHPVDSAAQYVTTIVDYVRAEVDDLRQRPEGSEVPPPLPALVLDAATPPTRRLQELAAYLRECTPTDEGRVVLMLLPSAVREPRAWAEIASGLFLRGDVEPWMVRTRFILRDDPRAPVLVPFVDQHRLAGASIYEVDLRTKALIDSLAEEARDPSVPRPERMMAILQLACLDFSYGRLDEALAKYGALHNYFVESENPAAQAYCLQGAGDTLRRLGRLGEAKARYQQAMVVATAAQLPGISLNAAIGLGDTCAARQELAEARQWYALADQIASQTLNGVVRCDLAEKLGQMQLAARDYGGAATTWLRGAELSREQRYFTRWAAILERLAALYREARMQDQARRAEATLGQVRALLSRGHASCDCGVFA
ncbi:hypothetical protein [Sandaracinus amylolyticus]|uniref:Uncharacterized protein n=1 Tax=Sandaracinus amylolyticus TaxID=927083 RepID=A0A0F6YK30_9BACT|nr:hypothetical protein [Sandaracinus amylolyticus]AKF08828.1 hypothetical protein DB32_005977 [Sandaracinus amylolyticus]